MGGPGASTFDHMQVIVKWVEDGVASDRILASRPGRTHLLCAYPKVAKYSGKGSTDDATNQRITHARRNDTPALTAALQNYREGDHGRAREQSRFARNSRFRSKWLVTPLWVVASAPQKILVGDRQFELLYRAA